MNTNGRTSSKPTIVLVHGLWLTQKSWDGWVERYEKAGFSVVAPSWPGLEKGIDAIRRDPSPLKGLRITKVVDHYERVIRELGTLPIIMGHSFGGLITQLLIDRGLGAAGVLIASAQTAGIPVLPLSSVWSTLPILGNPFSFNGTTSLSPKRFNFAFTNELDAVTSRKEYDRLQIPAANRILWDAAFALLNPNAASKVNYHNNNRAPLLFIAGGNDHLAAASISRANMRKYLKNSTATVDYREFPTRTHHTIGQSGWEQVADFALQWAKDQIRSKVTLTDAIAGYSADRASHTDSAPATSALTRLSDTSGRTNQRI
jgi:pimeloyl-ACP methyl ester carboxylesterase